MSLADLARSTAHGQRVRKGGKPIATVSPDRSPAALSERANPLAALPPRAHIERIASRKIKGFCGTIDEDGVYYDPVHKQNQSLSQHIIADYHGRFLIELIQNGHDAHDKARRDGEIAVLLAGDEGDSGTLYVANRGQPFASRNVDALCEMGLSSKPPGEAVGNKGLGFRSVRHVSDIPQIYSRLAEDSAGDLFDGYRFTFARGSELDPLLPDEATRALARTDLPAFYIPRWLDQTPDTVKEFARKGFSSVIRLPLRNQAALDVVRAEILSLAKAEAPMLLFLRRIATLRAEIQGGRIKEDALDLKLTRSETPLDDAQGPALVDLGENGSFWVARAEIPEGDMQAAVAEGLESGALPESWNGWKGSGEVAVAVPIGETMPDFHPRLYTFLPMGRGATSPFRGHLHGSFFPSSNRTSLDPAVRVNALVLDHAVKLASATAAWLQRRGSAQMEAKVPVLTAVRAAVDLLLWNTPTSLLQGESDGEGEEAIDLGTAMTAAIVRQWGASSLAEADFVPCLAEWAGDALARPPFGPVAFISPAGSRRVQAADTSFSLDVIARHGQSAGLAPFWPGLGEQRSEKLALFLRGHAGGYFKDRMTASERAIIVEGLAKAIARPRRPDWARWTAFYRDLSDFMGNDSSALAGKAILICQDGSLRATRSQARPEPSSGETPKRRTRRAPREASVFVPPRRGDAEDSIGEDFYPPAPLREFFAFLHDRLPWYGELAVARQFLEKDLATAFESEALLTRISQILERDETKKVRAAGLRWAFAIWRRSVAIKRAVTLSPAYRLFVPTIDGEFIRASEAVFSSAWPDRTLGYDLQQFLELAPAGSADLAEVRARRLAAPSAAVFGTRFVDDWTDFLIGIGVQRGLEPRTKELQHYVNAGRVTSFDFLKDLGFPDSFGSLLKKDIATRPGVSLGLPTSTDYDVGAVWWMPGQADVDAFSDEALDAYAKLVLAWIGRAAHRHLWMPVKHRYNHRSDNRDWPTPLAAFLRSAAWLPCEEPGADGLKRSRQEGAKVWLPRGSDRFPPFLRRLSYKLARALDRTPDAVADTLRKHAGLKTFNAPDTLLEQAGFLAEQFAQGCIRRFHERELVNIYARCWARLAEKYGAEDATVPPGKPPATLLVRRRGQLGFATVAAGAAETIYVRDSTDLIATSLVEVLGDPLLDVRGAEPERLGVLLHKLYGNGVRRTSQLAYAIEVDGSPLEELGLGPKLVSCCPWLRLMLAVALEALDSVDLNRLPADRAAILQTLDRLELHQTAALRFLLNGQDVTPPTARGAYQFERAEGEPLLVVMGTGPLDWAKIEAALPAIGEAIGHSAVVPHMKLLARQLLLDDVAVDEQPSGQEDLLRLCRALELTEQAGEAARDALGERLDQSAPWLRAVVFHHGGENAFETWMQGEAAALEDAGAAAEQLRSLLPAVSSVDEIVAAARASLSAGELRERLGLEFESFNASLVATGSAPDVDPQGQQQQLDFYIADNRILIVDALRNLTAPTLLAFTPDPRYKAAVEALGALKPDPDWLLRYERIPEPLLAGHVAAWLAATGAPALGENPEELGDLAAVRTGNATILRQVARTAPPLVRAWGVQHSVSVGDLWRDAGQVETELRRRLDDAGAFDCRLWDEAELLIWLEKLGAWPSGMKHSLDRAVLGVPETDTEAAAQKAREERERRSREARSVRLNGTLRDPLEVDWLSLSAELAGSLSKKLLNRPIGSFAQLAAGGGGRGWRRGSGSGGGGGGGAYSGIPQEKKDMIGRLGELTVYHWLKARQPGQDIDRCWVSGNSGPFVGKEGRDNLGYDFRISFNKQVWYIEVKASTEDPCQFEMGETEVRWARDIARSRAADRYVIAYVANVGQTGATTIDILPNPLGPEADGVVNIAGDSIRYTFDRRR